MNRFALGIVLCGACVPALAQQGILYHLEAGSTLKIEHCLGPCACLPNSETGPMNGTFTLTFSDQGPLFADYTVTAIRWTALLPNAGVVDVLGNGTYRIGGEVANMQEMNLTLELTDAAATEPHPYTSGLVAVDPNEPFPRIGITVQSQVIGCNQYTLHLIAAPSPCQADCDGSGVLTANDFQCFLNHFAAGDPYANCDGSTSPPVLNANDFQCYLNRFAQGCS